MLWHTSPIEVCDSAKLLVDFYFSLGPQILIEPFIDGGGVEHCERQ